MAQYITINLKKDVIVMKLSEKATQADTIKSLKKKLPETEVGYLALHLERILSSI